MRINSIKEELLAVTSTRPGMATGSMMRNRAVALALIDGRTTQDALPTDWEQAKREFAGEPARDSKADVLKAAFEPERWAFRSFEPKNVNGCRRG